MAGDYLTQADLTGRFGSDAEVSFLTDTEDTGTPDTDVLDEVIASAESAVNIRLATRYATPVSSSDATTTAAVKRLALDMAEYFLRRRKREGLSADTQQMKADLDAELKALADGDSVLPGAAVPTSTTSMVEPSWLSGDRELSDDSDRRFTRDSASGL